MVVFLGPALLPGKTLSSSDTLRFQPPWLSSKPAELERPSNVELGDSSQHLQQFLRTAADEFPDAPLWNPNIAGGRPFHANYQASIFSPYSVPAYLLPFWTATTLVGLMKLWLAAFGTFLLARALGLRFGGALLAGLVFALNLKSVTWVIYPNLAVWALIPWLLLLTDRLVRRPDLLAGAGLAALVALQFLSGHPESSFHALLAAGAFFCLRLWQARRRGGATAAPAGRTTLAFVAAVAGGTALAAVTLVPFLELLLGSADIRDRAGESIDVHLPFKDTLGIFMPDYWGRPTQSSTRPILLERAMYVGALPLMLAAAALILNRTRERVWIAAFGALWFAVVVGIPPVLQIVTRLPLFSSGHNTRLIILTILAVALLAGWGLDDLTDGRRLPRPQRRAVIGVAAALLLVPLAYVVVGRRVAAGDLREALEVAFLFSDSRAGPNERTSEGVLQLAALIAWLSLAGAALLLLGLRTRGRVAPAAFVALAVALVCVDLFRIGMGYNPAIDRDVADVPETGALRYLAERRPARFVSTDDVPQNVIPMRFGLYEARGYDLPILRRYDTLWRREVSGGDSVASGLFSIPLRFGQPTPRALRALRLLGVTHVLQGRAVAPFDAPFDRAPAAGAAAMRPGWTWPTTATTLASTASGARCRAPSWSTPSGWWAPRRRLWTRSQRLASRAVAWPSPRSGCRGSRSARRGSADAAGTARITDYEPERVRLQVSSSGPALAVLGDNHYPGWKAEVDGRPADIERVDYLFRGVRVGAGLHTVEFRYEPLSWRIGWIVSLLALIGLVAALAIGLRRRPVARRARAPRAAA